jgi:hypothetical protein
MPQMRKEPNLGRARSSSARLGSNDKKGDKIEIRKKKRTYQ